MPNNESTIMEKLDYLEGTKTSIKNAIISKGQEVTENDTFRSYAQKIAAIETGIDTSDATATANDILAPETAYVNNQKITGKITTQYETISDGLDVTNITYNYRILSICEDAEICIIGQLNSTNDFYIYEFKEGVVGELLTTISPASFTNRGYNYLRYALIAPLKNIDNTINMSFDVNDNVNNHISHIIIQYDINNHTLLANTKAEYNRADNASDRYFINQPLIFNPKDPSVVAHSTLVVKNEGYGYLDIFRYNAENATFTVIASNHGVRYGDTNQNNLIVEWSQDGRYCLVTSGKWYPTRNVVYDTGINNSNAVRIWGANNTTPCCMWKNGYWFYGNQLKDSNNTTIRTYSSVSVDNGQTCIWTVKNYWIVWDRRTSVQIYSIDPISFDIIKITELSPFSYYDDQAYSGTPYCPTTNYGNYLLNSNNSGYYFKELNVYKKIISAKMYNTDLFNTQDGDVIANNILSGKIAYNDQGKVTGSMPNNGTLTYTPTTSQQTIPTGYTSGGIIEAVNNTIDDNITAGNIKKDVTILGITGTYEGTDTSDANATVGDILEGKTAYVNGVKLTGTLVPAEDLTEELTAQQTKIEELEALLQHKCDFQFKIYDTVAHMEEAEAQEGDKAVVYTENSNTFNFEGFYRYDGSDWIKLSPNITTTDLDNANSQVENLLS